MARKERPYTNETFALVGTCSFPFLAKTAIDEPGKYAEDKYKVTVNIDQKEFLASDLAAEAKRFIDAWYPEPLDVVDGLAGVKDLNEGLTKEDKYYDYKVDKYQVNAKRNPNSKKNKNQPAPIIYDEAGNVVTEEADILRIENGAKICAVVRPTSYGDADEYTKYQKGLDACGDDVKKIRAYVDKATKPIFGVTLELFAVQLVEPRKGGAPAAAAITAHIHSNVEVKPEDLDVEAVEEVVDEVPAEAADEDVDL